MGILLAPAWRLWLLILVVLASSTLNDAVARAQSSDVIGVVAPNVAHITVGDRIGSGFLVYPGNILIAAAHVIGSTSEAIVAIPGYQRYRARVLTKNIEDDVAILEVPSGPVPIGLRFAEFPPSAGDEVWLFGYPITSFRVVATRGIVSALYGPFYQIDAAAAPGSSGGPATTRGGRVVGMLSFGLKGHQGFNFLVGMPRLLELATPFLRTPVQVLIPNQPSQSGQTQSQPTPPSSPPTAPVSPPTAPGPSGPSTLPDGAVTWTVSAGGGIGPIAVGSHRTTVEARIGLPDENRGASSWIVGVYKKYGLSIFYSSTNLVDSIGASTGAIVQVFPTTPIHIIKQFYLTTAGVRLGDARDALIRAHGSPLNSSTNEHGVELLSYRGITFGIEQRDSTVIHIIVSRF
jgi:hypothetical protein